MGRNWSNFAHTHTHTHTHTAKLVVEMPEHGIDQLCISRTPLSVLGTSGGASWARALVSPRKSLNKYPSP